MAERKQGKLDKVLGILEKHSMRFLENEDRLTRMDNKIDLKFDNVLSGQDKIMLELERAREDRKLAKLKDDQQDERLDTLEQRMQTVEAAVSA